MKAKSNFYVVLHMPKTGGSSLRNHLREDFELKLYYSYTVPLRQAKWKGKLKANLFSMSNGKGQDFSAYDGIYGHFILDRYTFLKKKIENVKTLTWFREPAQRIVSHYNYWHRCVESDPNYIKNNKWVARMIDEEWTLEDFALHPHFRNLYSFFLVKHLSVS